MNDWGKLKFIPSSGHKLIGDDADYLSEFGYALDMIKVGSWEWDLRSNSMSCSPFITKLLNDSLENEVDINLIINQISPNDQNRVKNELINHLKNKAPFLIKFKLISKGEEYSLDLSGNPILDLKGNLIKVVGVIRDNSYRDIIVDSLIKSESDLRKTEKIAHIGSWRWSIKNKKFNLNQELWSFLADEINQTDELTYNALKDLFDPYDWKILIKDILSKVNNNELSFIEEAKIQINGKLKYINITFESEYEDKILMNIHGTIQDVSQKKIIEDQLKYRMEFERMISAISSNFINLQNDKVNIGINIALDILGTFLDIDRSFLCLFGRDHRMARCNFLWARSGFEYPKNFEFREFKSEDHFGLQEILKGKILSYSDLNVLDDSLREEKDSWFSKNVEAILCVPLYIEGKVKGALGLQCFQHSKTWDSDEINLIRMVGEVFINTLRRKEFEALQTDNEQFLSTIINSLEDGVFATNENGLITKMNTKAEALTGFNKKDALGKEINHILKFLNKEEDSYKIAKRVIESGSPINSQDLITVVSVNQNMVPVQISVSPLRQYGVELNGCVVLCRDMTNQVNLEEQLQQSEKMRLIGQLSGGIAHDFNNMLTGILGCANFLKKKHSDDSETLRYVENILITSRRATTLTSQLLAFSRRDKPKLVCLDCHDVIREIIQLVEITFDPSIKIDLNLESTKYNILGSVSQLHNTILNISMNAKDAMPNGGTLSISTSQIEVDVEMAESLKVNPGVFFQLIISDTGVGISKSMLNNIFEPFFTTKEKGKGTGLGLAVVYGTIISHKGAIRVNSEVGEGAEFIIYLPSLDTMVEEELNTNANVVSLTNKTILVVDDELLNCIVAKETLAEAGCHVLIEQNGLSAIDLYKQKFSSIDLVILDMLMPKITGTELLKKFVEINPNVQAIIASGYSSHLVDEEIIKERNIPFLQKPYEEKVFLNTIAKELSN
ncbi:MAG: hypothetical protein COA79_05160 [Planctomycetota bacterium]|nr:MAG: hypothetical protein COA79_05160 [Planctomycetota bacterium]